MWRKRRIVTPGDGMKPRVIKGSSAREYWEDA